MKVSELKEKIGKREDVLILDVREAGEYEASATKIAGAQNVPMGAVFVKASKGELPKDKKIITVCKAGTRCEIVARELKQKGYDIEHLEGGFDAWEKESGT